MPEELKIPDAVLDDADAFELLRVWASRGEQFVTIETALSGDASHFGVLIADLIQHGAVMYAQRDGSTQQAARDLILSELRRELGERKHDVTGLIHGDA